MGQTNFEGFMRVHNAKRPLGLTILCAALFFVAACSAPTAELPKLSSVDLDPARQQLALLEVQKLQSKGHRVWCVPFARNASGVQIRGNANTWWGQAQGIYDRGSEPIVGAVMAFSKTRKNPMGHVAVVSEVVSDREIKVDHANWKRNKVSLKMNVIDVSDNNDWSAVRLMSQPNAFGSVYPIRGFIYAD
jgi:hypothetical protein